MPKNKFILIFFICTISILICAINLSAQDEFTYDSKGRRDPFIPLVTSDGRLLKLEEEENKNLTMSLEGIIYDEHAISYAILNGEVVKVGDTIGDYQVLKIEKNKVVLIKEGETEEIWLKKEE